MDIKWDKTNKPRPWDQKIKVDVVHAVANVLITFPKDNFIAPDYYHDAEIRNYVTNDFILKAKGKLTDNEWDKFFAQPLNMFARGGILSYEKIGKSNRMKIIDKEALEVISTNLLSALEWLIKYVENFLVQNGLKEDFDSFFISADNTSAKLLRNKIKEWARKNTNIKNNYEPTRVINPLFNIYAYSKQKRGLKKGWVSEEKISFNDLIYNRTNFRDWNKEKNKARKEMLQTITDLPHAVLSENNAKQNIKKINEDLFGNKPDFVMDPSKINANQTHAHHIFSKHKFPEYASSPENLILLDPTTHFAYAHAGNTSYTDPEIQFELLKVQLRKINEAKKKGSDFYDLKKFVLMVLRCLDIKETITNWPPTDEEIISLIEKSINSRYGSLN